MTKCACKNRKKKKKPLHVDHTLTQDAHCPSTGYDVTTRVWWERPSLCGLQKVVNRIPGFLVLFLSQHGLSPFLWAKTQVDKQWRMETTWCKLRLRNTARPQWFQHSFSLSYLLRSRSSSFLFVCFFPKLDQDVTLIYPTEFSNREKRHDFKKDYLKKKKSSD